MKFQRHRLVSNSLYYKILIEGGVEFSTNANKLSDAEMIVFLLSNFCKNEFERIEMLK